MGKTLKAYYQEGFEQLADLVQRSQERLTTHFQRVLDELIDFDDGLTEEYKFLVIKNNWTKKDKAFRDRLASTEEHDIATNIAVNALSRKFSALRQKIKDQELDLPQKDCATNDAVAQYLEYRSPYARIKWAKLMLQRSRCVAQVCDQEGKVLSAGLLIEGNTLLTTQQVLPDADLAATFQIRIDFLKPGEPAKMYPLDNSTWRADADLNIACVQVAAPLSTWNMLPVLPATVKSNQALFCLSAGRDDQLLGVLDKNILLQYLPTMLLGDTTETASMPGAPVFDERGNWLGLHHGGTDFKATTAAAIKDFLEQPVSESEPPASAEKKDTTADLEAEKLRFFGEHHQYTCDRIQQYDRFSGYVDIEAGQQKKDLHYFYLHGGEMQSHVGLFNRFVTKLEGRDQDHISLPKSTKRVKDRIVSFPRSFRLENLKMELPVRVLKSFGLDEIQIERIDEKHLANILDYPNSPVYQWGAGDKICLLIEVSEAVWDKELTPEVATWFVEQFCQPGIPEQSPEFFIFFAINYDDEEPDEIKTQVLEALNQGRYMEHLFPELDMVESRDIRAWFAEYAVFWDHDRKAMRHTRKRHFGDNKEPRYMEDVQDILADIIEEINNNT